MAYSKWMVEAATGLSRMTVNRIWRAFGLRPHRSETFKLSPDPLLIEKVRDIVGLYVNPPDHAVVLCVDEKSQIQALDCTAPLLPVQPGQAERRTHDYRRHGTTSLFCSARRQDWHRHRRDAPPPPGRRVPQVPRPPRRQRPLRPRRAHHHGQPRDPQDAAHLGLVRQAAAVPRSLHPDLRVLAQPH